MNPQPGTCTSVKFTNDNYEERILKLFDKSKNDCDEEFHLKSIYTQYKLKKMMHK